jgi:hypothetical protein
MLSSLRDVYAIIGAIDCTDDMLIGPNAADSPHQ